MLTRKQHELLLFINRHITETGVSPSFDEMKDALGLKSKSGIHRLVTGLEERGFLKRLAHRARALEVMRLPNDAAVAIGATKGRFAPQVIEGGRGERNGGERNGGERNGGERDGGEAGKNAPPALGSRPVPLLGRIAAGTPIEALRDESNLIEVPPQLAGRGHYYCLEVDGDSMVEAGILDGDTVIIERCKDAENGSIVVALVDGQEVTLKRLRKRHKSVALEPANARYETRIFGPDQVEIQGRLVGLMRRY